MFVFWLAGVSRKEAREDPVKFWWSQIFVSRANAKRKDDLEDNWGSSEIFSFEMWLKGQTDSFFPELLGSAVCTSGGFFPGITCLLYHVAVRFRIMNLWYSVDLLLAKNRIKQRKYACVRASVPGYWSLQTCAPGGNLVSAIESRLSNFRGSSLFRLFLCCWWEKKGVAQQTTMQRALCSLKPFLDTLQQCQAVANNLTRKNLGDSVPKTDLMPPPNQRNTCKIPDARNIARSYPLLCLCLHLVISNKNVSYLCIFRMSAWLFVQR